MRKLLNKPWVVALLAFAAIALVAQSVLDRPKRRPQRPAAAVTAASEELPEDAAGLPPAASGSLTEALASLSFPDQLPDPFAPRRQRVAEVAVEVREAGQDVTETVRLTAIWDQDGATYVLLNGRICRSGESLGRITIDSIERDGVWLAHWKGRDFVRLGQEFTLVTPAAAAAKPRTATHEG